MGDLKPIVENNKSVKAKILAVAALDNVDVDTIDNCLVPEFREKEKFELPDSKYSVLRNLLHKYKALFSTIPGRTDQAYHYISTTGPPVRVPPRRIPVHFREEIEQQLQTMLELGIIEKSNSPWMAPAVFVPKKSGEIRMCVDYRELNKRSCRDAYPLPLPDDVQDRLAGSTIFSTLDLHSGYWQLPVHPEDYHKTAFCPGPGMGLYHFRRMPFGLSGAPSSFQRLMDTVLHFSPYIDDIYWSIRRQWMNM